MRTAGTNPESIQFLTVCWFSLRIAATSATVMNSSGGAATSLNATAQFRRWDSYARAHGPCR